jgi:hypothetical protein
MGKVEGILKAVASPTEALIQTFRIALPDFGLPGEKKKKKEMKIEEENQDDEQ